MTTRSNIRSYRKIHAINRLMDRHAVRLEPYEYEEACNQIKTQTAEFITRLSSNKTVWYVEIQGQQFSCIYHKKTNGIVTFCNNRWLRNLKRLAKNRIERLKTTKPEQGVTIEEFFKKHATTTQLAIG